MPDFRLLQHLQDKVGNILCRKVLFTYEIWEMFYKTVDFAFKIVKHNIFL